MDTLAVSTLIFAIVFGGAIAGIGLRRTVPPEHLGSDAKETVRLATGLVVTMTGLVLGMLVSSAKSYYDGQKNVVAEMSARIVQLDSLLLDYGPEAGSARRVAREFVEDSMYRIWPEERSETSQLKPKNNVERINKELERLAPKDERQAALRAQIASAIRELQRSYWLMYLVSEQASVSIPLFVVVTSWLVAIFVSFGMFAPSNSTVMITLVVCALAVSAAIFIIMQLYSPFSGILKISPVAIRDALKQMALER